MKSRTQNSMRNSTVALMGQSVILITQFITQTAFVRFLGAQYVGANGLFTNLLTLLSFADLGLGGAITFSLYAPLAEDNHQVIKAIMNLFRKTYHVIALTIFGGGLLFSFFIQHFINKNSSIPNVQLMFLLFVVNSAVSYFFAYLRSLLVANQQGYVDTLNRVGFTAIQCVFQVATLALFHQYIVFLLIQILFTVGSNLSLATKTFKWFPYLRQTKDADPVPKDVVATIKRNVVGAIASRFGIVVSNGTDNLLLSTFIGLVTVGKYTSYMLIFTSSQNILNQGFSAVVSSIANYSVEKNGHQEETVFFRYLYLVFGVAFIASMGLVALIQPFIKLWIGASYLLPNNTVLGLVLVWFTSIVRYGVQGFITAHGLYWETRWKSAFEAIVNLAVSLFLITQTKLGVNAVIIGTLTATVGFSLWWEPLILLKNIVGISWRRTLFYYARLFAVEGLGLFALSSGGVLNLANQHGFLSAVIIAITVAGIAAGIYLGVNFQSKPQRYFCRLASRFIFKPKK